MAGEIPIPIPTLGLIKSVDRESVPPSALAEAENWIYRDRHFRVRNGLTALGSNTVSGRPTGIIHYDHSDGALRTVLATATGWYNFNYGTRAWTLLTGTALTATTQQQAFRIFHKGTPSVSYLLGVNGKDAPKKWDGNSAGYSDIAGSPPIARAMLILNNQLILGNLTSGVNISPVGVDWSAFGDFDSGWGAQATNLRDTPGPIVFGEEMGNEHGALVKTDAAYRAIAQAGTVPFRFDWVKVPKDGGAAANQGKCVIGDGRLVWLALNATLKVFDLNTVADFGSDSARVHLQDTIDSSLIGRSWMSYDSSTSEVLIVYASKGGSGDPDTGLIISKNGSIYPMRWAGRKFSTGSYARITRATTIGDLKVNIGSIQKTLGELGISSVVRETIAADTNGQAVYFSGNDDLGSPISGVAETGLASLGSGSDFKTIKSISHRFNKPTDSQVVKVRVGFSRDGEDRTLEAGEDIDIASGETHVTGHRTTSRYLSMRMEVNASKPVIYRGSFVDAAPRGRWR